MNVSFSYFKDRGQLGNERIVLKVLADDNIGDYVVLRSRYRDGNVTTGITHTFWFPDREVKAGDYIVLYTKPGVQSEKVSGSGATSHFFYWSQPAPLWQSADHAVVVLYAPDWISATPEV